MLGTALSPGYVDQLECRAVAMTQLNFRVFLQIFHANLGKTHSKMKRTDAVAHGGSSIALH